MKKMIYLLLLILMGCVPGHGIGSPTGFSEEHFAVKIPQEWRRLNSTQHYILTREGAFSQYILVQQRPLNRPFRHTKRRFTKGMAPQEASEVVLDEILSDQSIMEIQIMDRSPAMVNQYRGFKLLFAYKTKAGFYFKTLYYGFLKGQWFYSIRYNASVQKYSPEDVEALKEVIESFEIKGPSSA